MENKQEGTSRQLDTVKMQISNGIGATGAQPFAVWLEVDTTVTTLDLSEQNIGAAAAQALAESLKVNTTVTTLDLSEQNIGAASAQALAESLKVNTTVTTLDLSFNYIGDAGVQALAESLKENTTLTTLNLTGNDIGDAAQALAELLKVNNNLETLDLCENDIGAAGAQALAESLKENTALTTLDLSENDIGAAGAQALAGSLKENTTLTTLNLSLNFIGDAGVQALAGSLKKNATLTTLNLNENDISAAGAQALAESLKVNTTVTTLDLSENDIGAAGARALAKSLKVNKLNTVTTLNLSLNGIGDAVAKALAKLLKVNTTVTTLDLSSNNIGVAGAQALAESLKVNTTVTTLDLSWNEIGDAGAQALAESLKVNTTVTTLSLASNDIGNAGAKALAKSVKVNTTVTTLDLHLNNIGNAGRSSLTKAHKANSTLLLWISGDSGLEPYRLAENKIESNGSIPTIISARGRKALAAYERALKFGRTHDKRVKVALIGKDRVGKTSVGRSLKGEPFNKEEPSTDGVQMNSPIKNAGAQAWKNLPSQQHTTAFDHKCAEVIFKEVKETSTEQQPSEKSVQKANKKQMQGLLVNKNANKPETTVQQENSSKKIHQGGSQENENVPVQKNKPNRNSDLSERNATLAEDTPTERNSKVPGQIEATLVKDNLSNGKLTLPDQIATLVEEYSEDEGIWPFIWDFAGQAVYRAIHPIFMSPEAIYLLVIDLTKELSDSADCLVKLDDYDEEIVASPESEDTNLDHILRWMTLVHSLKQSIVSSTETPSAETPKPPPRSVILVGSKADMVEGDPVKKMESLLPNIFRNSPKVFLKHIAEERFVLDNTRAGKSANQESRQIADLREKIIDLANEMPHTKHVIPLQWLSVEQEIRVVSQNVPYVLKTKFRREIAEKCCTLKEEDDLEELLHFLHARGSIIYHDLPENPDGLVVLDPQWLIRTICEIINAKPKWTYPPDFQDDYDNLQQNGVLSKELLDLACLKLNISDIENDLIFIMTKFNLIFEWKNADNTMIYAVPCMLSNFKEVNEETNNGPAPLCLRFDKGGYVPCGLFTRLVGLFGVWASKQCTAEQPDLSSNVALFFVGEKYKVHLVCYSTVIKVYFSSEDASDQMETNSFCVKIVRQLEKSWTKLKTECHWLNSVCLNLCARCESRSALVCRSTPCVRHSKQGCSHDDCAHYLDLKKPLACKKQKRYLPQSFREKYKPWIEALKNMGTEELPAKNVIHVLQKMHCDAAKVHKETNLSVDLMKITSDKGFTISENGASGNCMFYALSEQLEQAKGVKVSHQDLRETLVQFLRENRYTPNGTDQFSFVLGYPTWSDYLRGMAKDGTWGDHLILRAAANYYKTRIRIISSLGNELVIDPDYHILNTNPLVLGHIHELHYVSLLPRQANSVQRRGKLLSHSTTSRPKFKRKHLAGNSVKRRGKLLSHFTTSRPKFKRKHLAASSAEDQPSPVKRKRKVPSNGKTAEDISMTSEHTKVLVKEGIPDDEVLEGLAQKIPDKWKKLGRRLKIGEEDLIAIHKENEECCEKAYNMLLKWKRANTSKGTYHVLYKALCHHLVDRRDLAEIFCCGGHE